MTDPELLALAERLQGLCLGRGLSVATAESCTGGMLASVITDIPGASGYFRGSIVAYADATKVALLDVPEATLGAHGAVSAQVARVMATGLRDRLGVSLAISITGVSGPDGGSDEKPVGLTYIGLADRRTSDVRRHTWTGDRATNRRESVRSALRWLIERAETPAPEAGP